MRVLLVSMISLWSIFFGGDKNVIAKRVVAVKQPELYETIVLYIKSHEGLELRPYKCSAGVWTIGWGHRIKDGESFGKISMVEANAMFLRDFNERFESARRAYPGLERRKLLVLTAASYNLGTGIFLNKNSVSKAIKQGRSIRFALIKYCLVNKKFNQVISNRRKFECALYDMKDSEVKYHKTKYKLEVKNQINRWL